MDKRVHHYSDDGQEIVLSGQQKNNKQVKSDYQRMIERWRKVLNYGKR